jgi:hypothetical protein
MSASGAAIHREFSVKIGSFMQGSRKILEALGGPTRRRMEAYDISIVRLAVVVNDELVNFVNTLTFILPFTVQNASNTCSYGLSVEDSYPQLYYPRRFHCIRFRRSVDDHILLCEFCLHPTSPITTEC